MEELDLQKSLLSNLFSLSGKQRTSRLLQLKPEYFSEPIAQKIFKEMTKDPEADNIVVCERVGLSKSQALDWTANISSFRGIGSKIDEIKRQYKIRLLGDIKLISENATDPDKAVEKIHKVINEITLTSGRSTGDKTGMVEEYDKQITEKFRLESPIPYLNELTGGLRRGQVWVVGGTTGAGKSFFVQDFALNQSLKSHKVLFFSTELTVLTNMERFGEMMKFYSGAQNTREGIEMIEEMKNLYIYDDLRSVNEIALEIKRQNMIEQVDLIVLDHLQDMSSTNDRQYESINEICEMIKDLSIKLNIPSIIVSQLNRQGTRETTKDKFVFSFTGSGKIEQIAQVAMVILRDVDDNSKTYCKIVKNRGNVDTPKCGTGLVLMEQLNTYNFVPVNYSLKENAAEKILGDL